MQHTEIKLNSKEIFKGNVFRVTMDQVELENGMTSFREVVHHNGMNNQMPPAVHQSP